MTKRFIAFGCSFTHYFWSTWADIIGENFDTYLNFGLPSGSNMDVASRFIKMDNKYQFNSDDLVMIGITGFRRFSFFCEKKGYFRGFGDIKGYISNPDIFEYKIPLQEFYHHFYSDRTSIYYNHMSLLTVKGLLEARGIPHKFFMAINNLEFLVDQPHEVTTMANEIYKLCVNDESLEEFNHLNRKREVEFDDGETDGHPDTETHFGFIKKYFPEFDTVESANFTDRMSKSFKTVSKAEQTRSFNQLMRLGHKKTF